MKKVALVALALATLSMPAFAGPKNHMPTFNAGSPVFNVRQFGCSGGCSTNIVNAPSYNYTSTVSKFKTIDKSTNYNSYYGGYGWYGGKG